MSRLLVDISFLYALADPSDKYRSQAMTFASQDDSIRIIPDVALTEVTYLLQRFINYTAAVTFLRALTTSDAELAAPIMADVGRAHEIMTVYADARFDFVDCCIMALAERLQVTRICTFDRRDFAIFRPIYCDFLELLP